MRPLTGCRSTYTKPTWSKSKHHGGWFQVRLRSVAITAKIIRVIHCIVSHELICRQVCWWAEFWEVNLNSWQRAVRLLCPDDVCLFTRPVTLTAGYRNTSLSCLSLNNRRILTSPLTNHWMLVWDCKPAAPRLFLLSLWTCSPSRTAEPLEYHRSFLVSDEKLNNCPHSPRGWVINA